MERLTKERQIGCFGSLIDPAAAKSGLFTDYDGFYAYHLAVTRLKQYEDIGSPEEFAKLFAEKRDPGTPSADELEDFVRCEDCVHGGWTDDVSTHCNLWHTREDPMCVGYLGFCGAGEKGAMLEINEVVEP